MVFNCLNATLITFTDFVSFSFRFKCHRGTFIALYCNYEHLAEETTLITSQIKCSIRIRVHLHCSSWARDLSSSTSAIVTQPLTIKTSTHYYVKMHFLYIEPNAAFYERFNFLLEKMLQKFALLLFTKCLLKEGSDRMNRFDVSDFWRIDQRAAPLLCAVDQPNNPNKAVPVQGCHVPYSFTRGSVVDYINYVEHEISNEL